MTAPFPHLLTLQSALPTPLWPQLLAENHAPKGQFYALVATSLLEGVSCGLAKDLGRVVLANFHHLTLPEQLNRRPVRGPLVYPILKYLDVVSFDFGSHYHLTRHIKSLCNRLTQLYLLHVRALPNHS